MDELELLQRIRIQIFMSNIILCALIVVVFLSNWRNK